MKTTNKLLIAGLVVGLAFTTYFVLKITSFIQIEELNPSGYVTTDEVEVEPFNSLIINKGIIVNLSYSDTESVQIIADTAFRNLLSVNVEGQELKLEMSRRLPDTLKIMANISTPSLNKITINNRAELISYDTLSVENLRINANNGSKIDLVVNATLLNCQLNNGAKLKLAGNVDSLDVQANNAAKLHAPNLNLQHAKAEANNAGYIHFFVSGSIDVKAINAGTIEYGGNPQVINMEARDAGKLVKVKE